MGKYHALGFSDEATSLEEAIADYMGYMQTGHYLGDECVE